MAGTCRPDRPASESCEYRRLGDRHAAANRGSATTAPGDLDDAADRLDAVAHVDSPLPGPSVVGIEPDPGVMDLEAQIRPVLRDSVTIAVASGPACLTTFWIASRQQKYTATSTSSGVAPDSGRPNRYG